MDLSPEAIAALSPWPQVIGIAIAVAIAGAVFSIKKLEWLKKIVIKPWL